MIDKHVQRIIYEDSSLVRLSVLFLLACVLAILSQTAFGQAAGRGNFDHLTTGFPLTGAHQSVRCESCHLRGIFKGTPKQCSVCHTAGTKMSSGMSTVIMPVSHMPTAQPCDTCHTTTSFTGVRFTHANVTAGTCSTCHNGRAAPGLSLIHI